MTTGNSTSSANASLGTLKSWSKETYGLHGTTDQGNFRVLFYNDQIARITISRQDTFEDFSYAVVTNPQNDSHTIVENALSIEVSTAAMILNITKHPVRFTFQTHSRQNICEDDAAFGTSWNGEQITTYKKLQDGERFVGLGEKTGPLDRKGSGYQNWNTDSFGYGTGADPLYSSIPFYIGIHHHLAYGIFMDNTHKSFFNFGASNDRFSSFAADAGEMDYYFIHSTSVAEIIRHYTHLTGRMEMPPLWSIGYQQCRYSYYPDKEVLTLAKTFRDKDIPADAIVLDIHYMEQYKIFTWSAKDFPDPKGLVEKLSELGFNVVVMCDPGIKVEDTYKTYQEGIAHDVFIKYPDGTNYTGQVWPGWCHFPDFTNPQTRHWWKDQFHHYVDLGIEGFWNDMNEIATWGNMVPENIEMNFDGNPSTMRRGRNVYGYQMARSTYEGAKSLLKGKRLFNLTRSGYAGIQRYAAVWTGDNVGYDEHMLLGVRMVSSMGLSGVAFAGYDVGGFVGDANAKLFARWISLGAFSPFFRGHSMINSRDSEPWAYGEEVEQISRNYIKFRYQLLPYLYSLFYDASQTGLPIQRALAIAYTHDPKIYDGQFQNQYLLGPYFLVTPVESDKNFVKVYLPEGQWYSLYNGDQYAGNTEMIVECPLHRLPVFVKAGAILPAQPQKSNTKETNDTLIVHAYGGGDSSFLFYEDDGATFAYQDKMYAKREFTFDNERREIVLTASEGEYRSPIKKMILVLHGIDQPLDTISVNGKDTRARQDTHAFFPELEKFDPFYHPSPAALEVVYIAEFAYSANHHLIKW